MAMYEHIVQGDVERIKSIVGSNEELLHATYNGWDIMRLAIYYGHKELFDWLKEQGGRWIHLGRQHEIDALSGGNAWFIAQAEKLRVPLCDAVHFVLRGRSKSDRQYRTLQTLFERHAEDVVPHANKLFDLAVRYGDVILADMVLRRAPDTDWLLYSATKVTDGLFTAKKAELIRYILGRVELKRLLNACLEATRVDVDLLRVFGEKDCAETLDILCAYFNQRTVARIDKSQVNLCKWMQIFRAMVDIARENGMMSILEEKIDKAFFSKIKGPKPEPPYNNFHDILHGKAVL